MKKAFIASLGLLAGVIIVPTVLMPAIASTFNGGNQIRVAQNQQQPVQLVLAAEKRNVVLNANGEEKIAWNPLPSNSQVVPGNVLRYVLTAQNNTGRNMRNLIVSQPVPDGMVYVLQTATKSESANSVVDFSIDGGRTFSVKPVIPVRSLDGKVEDRPAPPEAYTHVRWNFGDTLPANSKEYVSYQVRVK